MHISEPLLEEYVAQRFFVKPEITMNHYSLKWNESSYGIPQSEVQDLKAFLKDILPYISGAFFKAAGQIAKTMEEEVGNVKNVRKIHDSFSPKLQISHRRADHEYTLQMQEDGTTMIRRYETVTTSTGMYEKSNRNANLYINFILGELVFIR
jgi:hypothetical protein